MKQDLFKKLPSEITIDILSRLPVRTVASCKCVCKPWLHLLETSEFVKSHLSKSVPALIVLEREKESKLCRLSEFKDGLDLESHELHYNPVTKFSLPYHGDVKGNIYGSVNGLLFLRDKSLQPDGLFICNPITRDYIKLHCPQEFVCSDIHVVAYGFGVSKKNWIVEKNSTMWFPLLLAVDLNGRLWISCFDLEKETFGVSLTPPPCQESSSAALCAFRDSLCLCDNDSEAEIVVWSVQEDGDEKFWVQLFAIRKTPEFFPFRFMIGLIFPLKVFKDGDILFEWDGCFLFRYTDKEKFKPFDMFCSWHEAIIHTPSFLSLKSFNMEDVSTL
ncbi:hypothetical protein ACS0TY_027996 [Phlomoides rotata]